MPAVTLDMYQTLAVAVAALVAGGVLKRRFRFLEKVCIPAPVAGGLLFSVVFCILHFAGILDISFTDTLQNVCMVFFFTSVGFQANIKVLKTGGKALLVFFFLVIILMILQDLVAIGTAGILHLDPLMGMCTGSIPMLGGHGTAAAFGKILEQKGLNGATTVCMAAATYGLIAGSLMGGPLANRLIQKNHLQKTDEANEIVPAEIMTHRKFSEHYAPAAFQLAAAAGIGTIFSALLSRTEMTFPAYIGAMIAAALVRNLAEYSGKFRIHTGEIEDIGGIMLSLFLGIAMIRLRIWDLADLAFPLLVLLAVQTVFMLLFVRFVVFRAMGRDYDAAVISAGTCGFGMGATPNAMANMQAVTKKYGSSIKAFIIIPIVGSLFADFCNSMVIAFFINLF